MVSFRRPWLIMAKVRLRSIFCSLCFFNTFSWVGVTITQKRKKGEECILAFPCSSLNTLHFLLQ